MTRRKQPRRRSSMSVRCAKLRCLTPRRTSNTSRTSTRRTTCRTTSRVYEADAPEGGCEPREGEGIEEDEAKRNCGRRRARRASLRETGRGRVRQFDTDRAIFLLPTPPRNKEKLIVAQP